eukprot:15458427-Alexandrium_andersonii.AAC.1
MQRLKHTCSAERPFKRPPALGGGGLPPPQTPLMLTPHGFGFGWRSCWVSPIAEPGMRGDAAALRGSLLSAAPPTERAME